MRPQANILGVLVRRAKSAVMVTLLAGLMSPALAQTGQPAGPLTVNWYHGAAYLQPVIDAFTKDTGIAVDISSAYDRFDTDVVLVSDYKSLSEGKKLGHFQPLLSATVERVVPARWRDSDGYWTGVVLRARAPIYNKAQVASADAPRSWLDLADPRWKGKLTLRGGNNVYNRSLVAWMIHHYGEPVTTRWAPCTATAGSCSILTRLLLALSNSLSGSNPGGQAMRSSKSN